MSRLSKSKVSILIERDILKSNIYGCNPKVIQCYMVSLGGKNWFRGILLKSIYQSMNKFSTEGKRKLVQSSVNGLHLIISY